MAFKKKETTSSEVFALTVPLRCEPWQRDKLDAIFQCCNNVKNALISKKLKALKQLERTVAWKSLKAEMAAVYAEMKDHKPTNVQLRELRPLFRKSKELLSQYGITKNDFESDVKYIAKHFGKNVHIHVAQKLSYDTWSSFEKIPFRKWQSYSFQPCRGFFFH